MSDNTNELIHQLSARLDSLEKEVTELRRQNAELQKTAVRRRSKPHLPVHCKVGTGSNIDPQAVLWAGSAERAITIGKNCTVRRGAEWIGPITVGDRTIFNRDSYVRANVTIGNRVNVGAFVRFITDSHEIGGTYRRAGKGSFPPITVGDGTWIGAGSIILGGVTIGAGAVVAAGTVVNKDVPDNTLVGGAPMRVIRDLGDALE